MNKLVWIASDPSLFGLALCQAFARQGYQVRTLHAGKPVGSQEARPSLPREAACAHLTIEPAALVDAAALQEWLLRQEARMGPIDTFIHVAQPLPAATTDAARPCLLSAVHARLCQHGHGRLILVLPAAGAPLSSAEDCPGRRLRELAQQGLGRGVTVNLIRAGSSSLAASAPAFRSSSASVPAAAPPCASTRLLQESARRNGAIPAHPNQAEELAAPAHLSQAEEIANLALWLASPEAATLTGADFVIHGPG